MACNAASHFEFLHSSGQDQPILIPAIGLELFVRLPPSTAGGGMTIIETINAAGFGPPLHRHHETEVFRVLSGRYLYEVDGRRFYADQGDVVCIPGGAAHGFVNVSDTPSSQFILMLPGMDAAQFFTGLGAVMRDGPVAREVLNQFGKPWGVEFLGPPLQPGPPEVIRRTACSGDAPYHVTSSRQTPWCFSKRQTR